LLISDSVKNEVIFEEICGGGVCKVIEFSRREIDKFLMMNVAACEIINYYFNYT
jgi:hypothetical protein